VTEANLGRLGAVSGRSRDVNVTLTGLSFRETSAGRRYPYGEFGPEFIDALHKALSAPRHRGLFRSEIVCPSCETSLEGIPGARVVVASELALSRIPPIRVDLEMPGITCPSCVSRLVRIDDRAIESDLSDAVIAAFTAAGMSPG
jgi:hypothetical protein